MANPSRHQLRALVTMRWAMIRSPAKQGFLLVLLASLPALLLLAVLLGLALPAELRGQARVALPTLLFVVLAVSALAPIAAGGATELFPADQLVNYPVTTRTRFSAGLLLIPLNLAWVLQIFTLVALGVYGGAGTGRTVQLMSVLLLFAILATILGQALAWISVGSRSTRVGRLVTSALGIVAVVALVSLVLSGGIADVADRSPLLMIVALGFERGWWLACLALLGAILVAYLGGLKACAWAARRVPETSGVGEDRRFPRRRSTRSELSALTAVERASVLRSTPIRRGLILLVLVPPITASLARLSWDQMVIIPGLVAAGAGLLYGINVFALDGGGALWLASAPHDQQVALVAKARVLVEVCLTATALAVLVSALTATGTPDGSETAAVAAATLGGTTWVVGTCLRASIRHPHHAALRGPRDAPAPPGVMTGYSIRLAGGTTCIGLALIVAARLDSVALAFVIGASAVVLGSRKVVQADRLWQTATDRARIATTVAAG
jgi:hypothetical protein